MSITIFLYALLKKNTILSLEKNHHHWNTMEIGDPNGRLVLKRTSVKEMSTII